MISDYTELQSAVGNWLHRADLTSRIPEFIALGEAKLNRRLRAKEMQATEIVTTSTVNDYVALPTSFMEVISFNDDLGESLKEVDLDQLDRLSYLAEASRPEYFNINSRIDFERISDTAYNFSMSYWKRLDIATDLTNLVLTRNPDLYLMSAMLQAEPYMKNDSRIQTWIVQLDEAIRELNRQAGRNIKKLMTDIPSNGVFDINRGY